MTHLPSHCDHVKWIGKFNVNDTQLVCCRLEQFSLCVCVWGGGGGEVGIKLSVV